MSSKKLSKFEAEMMERRARGRAAWGLYGAYTQEQNFEQERKKLLAQGLSSKEVDAIMSRQANHFIVG